LLSGTACADALERQGYRVTRIDVGRDIASVLATVKPGSRFLFELRLGRRFDFDYSKLYKKAGFGASRRRPTPNGSSELIAMVCGSWPINVNVTKVSGAWTLSSQGVRHV
jgi:hypothetical protein